MGRLTKEEEFKRELERRGVSLDDLPSFEIPDDPEEMLEEFKVELYRQMKSGDLKSTGLVNGLKAVAQLAEAYRAANPPEVEVEEQGIDEILADVGLPRDRRIEIGRQEVERLRERTNALEMVVARIEGEE